MNENITVQDKKKRRIWTIIFVLINVAVIAVTAINEFSAHPGGSAPSFSSKAWLYLGCTAMCLVVLFIAESLKYVLMMRTLGEPVSFRVAFETAALGKYYDCITPSGAGGQPFQIYWLHKNGYSDGASSAMTIAAFITMQAGFIIPALVILIFSNSVEVEAIRITAWCGLALFSLIPALMLGFSFAPNTIKRVVSAAIRLFARLRLVKKPEETTEQVVEMLDNYHTSLAVIAKKKLVLLCVFILSVIYRFALCSMPYFVLKMFDAPVGFMQTLVSTICIYATVALVPTPGNAGAAEGAFYIVFSSIGSGGVFWAMLIWRIFSYYSFLAAGAAVYGASALRKRRKREGETNE